jgi:hypothetical protein
VRCRFIDSRRAVKNALSGEIFGDTERGEGEVDLYLDDAESNAFVPFSLLVACPTWPGVI